MSTIICHRHHRRCCQHHPDYVHTQNFQTPILIFNFVVVAGARVMANTM